MLSYNFMERKRRTLPESKAWKEGIQTETWNAFSVFFPALFTRIKSIIGVIPQKKRQGWKSEMRVKDAEQYQWEEKERREEEQPS